MNDKDNYVNIEQADRDFIHKISQMSEKNKEVLKTLITELTLESKKEENKITYK